MLKAGSWMPRAVGALRATRRMLVLACVGLLSAIVFAHEPVFAFVAPATEAAVVQAVLAGYDLAADEALGGHTLERHVGKTDRELADRLRREPQISAASTYTDRATAERVVGAAIRQSDARIRAWAGRGGGARPNLVLNYATPGNAVIGRSLSRRARTSVDASRALVVLRWLPREQRWIVLTSYPEARR